MTSLEKLKSKHIKKNIQFVLIDCNGYVLESDNILFDCKIGIALETIHPFFMSIIGDATKEDINFSCVHLEINNTAYICDIEVKKQENAVLLILTDFSHHYNSFQSLAQSRNETAISSEALEIDNYMLSQKEVFKNSFISNFNHELVSPILSILTFTDFLKKTSLTSDQKDYLEIVSASAITLKSMVNDIFDISKIETGNFDIINKRFSLKRLIKIIKTDYNHRCKAKGLALKVIYDKDMPDYIVSDKLRLKQVITNLIDNAIKYTNKGHITVSIEAIYRRARNLTYTIKIIDTGVGISNNDYDYIFERFSRLESSRHISGNGLGLSITKDIVTLMQGEIHVNSQVGTGSIFTVTLRTTTPLQSPSSKRKSTNVNPIVGKKEILIVEDNYSDQLSIFKILAATKNYFIDIAISGEEAVKLHKKKKYDLILMDYKLKALDGLEASRTINKTSKQKTPILLVTALKIEDAISKHYQPYIETILYKPFTPETLLEHVTMHIN